MLSYRPTFWQVPGTLTDQQAVFPVHLSGATSVAVELANSSQLDQTSSNELQLGQLASHSKYMVARLTANQVVEI